jgi:osmotically-inducible protein OsmY
LRKIKGVPILPMLSIAPLDRNQSAGRQKGAAFDRTGKRPLSARGRKEPAMNDAELRQHVIDALEFEPMIDAANIGVIVDRNVVTLTGHVPNYAQKSIIESVVWKVKGVKGLAEEIEVRSGNQLRATDEEIAKRIIDTIQWNTVIPDDAIHVRVEHGCVTLTGKVEWRYQREAAQNAAATLHGVKGISNLIEIAPNVIAADVKQKIENALKRHADVDAQAIRVEVHDNTVTLEGDVNAWRERSEIERAAWAVPGVKAVVDHINIT